MSLSNHISGAFYDGKTSERHSGVLCVANHGAVSIDGIEWAGCDFDDLTFSSRIGNASRTIYFPDGAFFETKSNDAVDTLIRLHTPEKRFNALHLFESKLRYIVLSVLIIAAGVFGFVTHGVPAISKSIAYSLSPEFSRQLASESLQRLDESYFSRTELSIEKRKSLSGLFSENLPNDPGLNYTLHFRKGNSIGANAFALPDGTVVVTDELVTLSENDEEILSILYHEMGHVYHRHSLRKVIQSVGVLIVFAWVTGDVEMITDWSVVLPAFLVERKYSRDIESEADDYALAEMLNRNIDPIHFSNIMGGIEEYAKEHAKSRKEQAARDRCESIRQDDCSDEPPKDVANGKKNMDVAEEGADDKEDAANKNGNSLVLEILRSHPHTKERMEKFKKASERMNSK